MQIMPGYDFMSTNPTGEEDILRLTAVICVVTQRFTQITVAKETTVSRDHTHIFKIISVK